MSKMPFGLIASAIASLTGSQEQSTLERFRYASSVSFFEGKCQFWTGDVMFDPAGFREDLRSRFDPSLGMTVYHSSQVPAKCVAKAKKMAKQAGFRDVQTEVGEVDLSLP